MPLNLPVGDSLPKPLIEGGILIYKTVVSLMNLPVCDPLTKPLIESSILIHKTVVSRGPVQVDEGRTKSRKVT
jgi:hypothetical protein